MLIGGRLIFVKNGEDARKLFYVSDHGFLPEVTSTIKEVVFSFPWGINPAILEKINQSVNERGSLSSSAEEIERIKNAYLESVANAPMAELLEWHPHKTEAELASIQDKLRNDEKYRELECRRLDETIRYTSTVLYPCSLKLKKFSSDELTNIIRAGITKDVDYYMKIIALAGLAREINAGDSQSLFRSLYAYGDRNDGDSYKEFYQSINRYFLSSKVENSRQMEFASRQLALKMRGVLKGKLIDEDEINFLPNLVAAWFIAEPARNPVSVLTGLMLLDMIQNGISDLTPSLRTPH